MEKGGGGGGLYCSISDWPATLFSVLYSSVNSGQCCCQLCLSCTKLRHSCKDCFSEQAGVATAEFDSACDTAGFAMLPTPGRHNVEIEV